MSVVVAPEQMFRATQVLHRVDAHGVEPQILPLRSLGTRIPACREVGRRVSREGGEQRRLGRSELGSSLRSRF